MAMKKNPFGNGGPVEGNQPVGSAGQPTSATGDANSRSEAIRRRMDKKKMQDTGKK